MNKMVDIAQDPYNGNNPRDVWSVMAGKVSGLGQTFDDGSKNTTFWPSIRATFERMNLGQRLRGKRVIELGFEEDGAQFRDYCIQNGAAEHIGVNLYSSDSAESVIADTRVQVFGTDALQFLAQQEEDSAIIAEFMLLKKEMIRDGCRRCNIDCEQVARAIANAIYKVQHNGEYFITSGADEIFVAAGFVRQETLLLLLKP